MLATTHRLTDAESYRRVLRRGRRRGSPTVVVSLLVVPGISEHPTPTLGPTRVGLIVSRAVGGSVVRNRVKRRLRHLCAARLATLPGGSELVVRALPPAAASSSVGLGRDLDQCLSSLLERAGAQG